MGRYLNGPIGAPKRWNEVGDVSCQDVRTGPGTAKIVSGATDLSIRRELRTADGTDGMRRMVPGMGLEPMAFGFPWKRSVDQNPMSPTLYQLSHPGLTLPIGS